MFPNIVTKTSLTISSPRISLSSATTLRSVKRPKLNYKPREMLKLKHLQQTQAPPRAAKLILKRMLAKEKRQRREQLL
jgi:hypothetical protein